MKLVMHIGSHRAGSTSIQDYCFFNQSNLERSGIFYPVGVFPAYPRQHSELRKAIVERSVSAIQQLMENISSDAKQRGLDTVFMSGEDLCVLLPVQAQRFYEIVIGTIFENINIVLVLRNKRDYLLSQYKHNLMYGRPIDELEFISVHRFSPKMCFDAWTGLEKASLNVISYEQMKKNFLAEFFRRALDIEVTSEVTSNSSMDFLTLQITNIFLKSFDQSEIRRILYAIGLKYPRKIRFPIESICTSNIDQHYPDDEWRIDGVDPEILAKIFAEPMMENPEYVCKKMLALFSELLVHFERHGEDSH